MHSHLAQSAGTDLGNPHTEEVTLLTPLEATALLYNAIGTKGKHVYLISQPCPGEDSQKCQPYLITTRGQGAGLRITFHSPMMNSDYSTVTDLAKLRG
jgi:hypothetical protein